MGNGGGFMGGGGGVFLMSAEWDREMEMDLVLLQNTPIILYC